MIASKCTKQVKKRMSPSDKSIHSYFRFEHFIVCGLIQNTDSEDGSGNVAAIFGPNSPKTVGT